LTQEEPTKQQVPKTCNEGRRTWSSSARQHTEKVPLLSCHNHPPLT